MYLEKHRAQVRTLPTSQNMSFSTALRSALLHTRLHAFRQDRLGSRDVTAKWQPHIPHTAPEPRLAQRSRLPRHPGKKSRALRTSVPWVWASGHPVTSGQHPEQPPHHSGCCMVGRTPTTAHSTQARSQTADLPSARLEE